LRGASGKEKREKDLQQAETYLNAGSKARNDGKLGQAADAFEEAERRFRLAGDRKRAGESCSLLAAAQVQNTMPRQAIRSYQRALRLYKEADCPVNEADNFLAIGHIERHLGQLDHAQASYQMAQNLYRANGHLQGLGNRWN
jgi:tetratricopeptide (TPR) repeat protein